MTTVTFYRAASGYPDDYYQSRPRATLVEAVAWGRSSVAAANFGGDRRAMRVEIDLPTPGEPGDERHHFAWEMSGRGGDDRPTRETWDFGTVSFFDTDDDGTLVENTDHDAAFSAWASIERDLSDADIRANPEVSSERGHISVILDLVPSPESDRVFAEAWDRCGDLSGRLCIFTKAGEASVKDYNVWGDD